MTFSRFEPQPIECYPSSYSVFAGESIDFHVSVTNMSEEDVRLEIFRFEQIHVDNSAYGGPAVKSYMTDYRAYLSVEATAQPCYVATFRGQSHGLPVDTSENGCRWPIACSWRVPSDIRTGIYFARLGHQTDVTYCMFAVRQKTPSAGTKILCQTSVNTHQAYNAFGGYCLYGPPISLGIKNPISMERPCQLWDYILYESAILLWFDKNYRVDFCTNIDFHEDATLLDGYRLFVSCGHDEYWSSEMRENVESFGELGGNVLFLSGNTCYRPVRFLDHGKRMARRTLEYGDLGRPEALTTGINWSAGLWSRALPKEGFIVREQHHWAFANTGLLDGDTFGASDPIIGYETDAAVYDFQGQPLAPTPDNFVTLATAHLREWDDWYGRAATMGLFRRAGSGTVFNVGTTGWGRGLLRDSGNVDQITRNVVDRLTAPPSTS